MDQAFAAEAWGLDGADGPVEGDVDAFVSLLVRFFQHVLRDEVERAVDVLLAVFIEDAPGAAYHRSVRLGLKDQDE